MDCLLLISKVFLQNNNDLHVQGFVESDIFTIFNKKIEQCNDFTPNWRVELELFIYVYVCVCVSEDVMLLINLYFEPIFPWLEVPENVFLRFFYKKTSNYSGMAEYYHS